MNYYNPYLYSVPSALSTPKVGLLSRMFGKSGVTFSTILSGTQKVLGVANQAIPLVKQVQPMMHNAKTMFKIMSEFKRTDQPKRKKIQNVISEPAQQTNNISKEKASNVKEEVISKESITDNDKVNDKVSENNGPVFFI